MTKLSAALAELPQIAANAMPERNSPLLARGFAGIFHRVKFSPEQKVAAPMLNAPAWSALSEISASPAQITALFAQDPSRAETFSARLGDMLFDYSKTSMTREARALLLNLFEQCQVADRRDAMFNGEKINETEGRAVLHTALRNRDPKAQIFVDGEDVMPGIRDTLDRMAVFANGVRDGSITASDGGAFTDVVNIGIGGSDLGPVMVTAALAPYHDGPKVHYVSNVDGAHIHDSLKRLDPARTLVIIASKTFTTIETMTNAATARRWLEAALGDQASAHFAALSTAMDKTADFGIPADRVFGFSDWVGGRYSVWCAIGLPVMLEVGPENFSEFLTGAYEMDTHFCEAPADQNLPVMLALTGIWHSNICGYPSRALLPYDQRMNRFAAYVQQLDMESNGKGVSMDGTDLPRPSGPIVWGEPGTNGQHAFYQLIHQGTAVIPCEFMVAAKGHEPDLAEHHDLLISNCLAQAEALLVGRSLEEARQMMADAGLEGAEQDRQARHRVFSGNRPSTMLIYPQLTPRILGQIIALYEHRVFVEGAIWGLNSFDQWGVELGKVLAKKMQPLLGGADSAGKDGSTQLLLSELQKMR